MRFQSKPNIFLVAAAVLFSLVLVSAHFSSGMYARYTTRASGSDQASLAAFHPKADLTQGDQEGTYSLELDNSGSEVAVACTVRIQLDDSIPEGQVKEIRLQIDDKSFTEENTGEESNSFVFENVGMLAPKDSKTCTLTVVLDENADTEATDAWTDYDNDSGSVADGDCPFEVHVSFAQVN